MKTQRKLWKDETGEAIVEATILFPIILMIFAGLILLAMYLPTRANLQRATQYAATVIATEKSDTFLFYDTGNKKFSWRKSNLDNVYVSAIRSIGGSSGDEQTMAEKIVKEMEDSSMLAKPPGKLEVKCGVTNYVVYKEVVVYAKRTIQPPIDLSFVGFPEEISIEVASTAVVSNGDEMVRNMDIAADLCTDLAEKLHLTDAIDKVSQVCDKFSDFLGLN